jgi:N-acetylmuramoyl-L-alanine amidase
MKSALNMLFFKYSVIRFALAGGLVFITSINIQAQNNIKKTISTVVIDPGHGGKDPGAVTKRVREKDIVLAISLKVGEYIKQNLPDVKVIYTRSTDVFIPLEQRAEIANKNQADLFISIHANKTDHSQPHGAETFAMGLSRVDQNLEVAKKENAAILYEDNYEEKYGYDPNSAESYIVFSYVQNTYLHQSLDFANSIQHEFTNSAKRANRGVKQAGFLVLWKTAMPGVLIESGFISNPDEEKYLASERGQAQIATSIYRAFKNYKQQIESRSLYGSADSQKEDTSAKAIAADDTKDTVLTEDSLTELPQTTNNKEDVEFSIQISASKSPLSTNSNFFKGLKNIETIHSPTGYKYAVGRKKTYSEIVEYSKVVKNYFPDAFIIALRNGKIIPLKEALNEINN